MRPFRARHSAYSRKISSHVLKGIPRYSFGTSLERPGIFLVLFSGSKQVNTETSMQEIINIPSEAPSVWALGSNSKGVSACARLSWKYPSNRMYLSQG